MAQTANVSAATRRMIADDLIPARQGGAWLVDRGQHIRVIDVEGGQICDFVCFNGDKLTERFSQARTKANQGKFTISTGDHLYSRDNNVMLTIVEDTYYCRGHLLRSRSAMGHVQRLGVRERPPQISWHGRDVFGRRSAR